MMINHRVIPVLLITLVIIVIGDKYGVVAQVSPSKETVSVLRAQRFELIDSEGKTLVTILGDSQRPGHMVLGIQFADMSRPALMFSKYGDLLTLDATALDGAGHCIAQLSGGGKSELILSHEGKSAIRMGIREQAEPFGEIWNDGITKKFFEVDSNKTKNKVHP